jgi:proteasome alpha subunit
MSLTEAFTAALAALSASGNGERSEVAATQLEVAILDRTRDHRAFRRIRAARLEELIAESRAAEAKSAPEAAADAPASPPAPPADSGPATGPDAGSTDRGGGLGGANGTPPNPL